FYEQSPVIPLGTFLFCLDVLQLTLTFTFVDKGAYFQHKKRPKILYLANDLNMGCVTYFNTIAHPSL
ncbi:MAG: hypothetical protein ACNA7U_07410, partial [Candidatus Izemoplasmataceae bacterium]